MLKTINFSYSIISHLRENYNKIFSTIEELQLKGKNPLFKYTSTVFDPVLESNIGCTIVCNYNSAKVNFNSGLSYNTGFNMCTLSAHSGDIRIDPCYFSSAYLHTAALSTDPFLYNRSGTDEVIVLKDNPSQDELEAYEFMLLTGYTLKDARAILLNQVLMNSEHGYIETYVTNIEMCNTLDNKEDILLDLYYSTAQGLEDAARTFTKNG